MDIALFIPAPFVIFLISDPFAFPISDSVIIFFIFSAFVNPFLFIPCFVFPSVVLLPVASVPDTGATLAAEARQVATVKHLPVDFHRTLLGKLLPALRAWEVQRGEPQVLLAVEDQPRLCLELLPALAAGVALLALVDVGVALGVGLAGELGPAVRALERAAACVAEDVLPAGRGVGEGFVAHAAQEHAPPLGVRRLQHARCPLRRLAYLRT